MPQFFVTYRTAVHFAVRGKASLGVTAILTTVAATFLSSMSKVSGYSYEAAASVSASSTSALSRARALVAPECRLSSMGEFEGAEFFEENRKLLADAWGEYGLVHKEFAEAERAKDLLHPSLMERIRNLRNQPEEKAEIQVKGVWEEVLPGVFASQLLSEEGLIKLREEIDHLSKAGIPTRRPNGMNRFGLMFDKGGEFGGVPLLCEFLDGLVGEIVKPLAQTLFSDLVGRHEANDYYAFTVRYRPDEDTSLAEHRDASVVTLNMNIPSIVTKPDGTKGIASEAEYSGSDLYFLIRGQGGVEEKKHLQFRPGMAIIHRGDLRHSALPIESGQRSNLIVWLHGEGGFVRIAPLDPVERTTAEERWGGKEREGESAKGAAGSEQRQTVTDS